MAIIFTQTLPAGVPIQMLDAVTEEMGVDTNPPEGLIVHTHYEADGQVKILDVWESEALRAAFEADRLRPAQGKVAAQLGVELPQDGQPDTSTTEVHRVVRGR
jgi:hypothetical protein